jgi:hypothetical protein
VLVTEASEVVDGQVEHEITYVSRLLDSRDRSRIGVISFGQSARNLGRLD